MDEAYATGEVRKQMALGDLRLTGIDSVSLPELATWTGKLIRDAKCE
jgi:CRISPR system Cascade subunit CasC